MFYEHCPSTTNTSKNFKSNFTLCLPYYYQLTPKFYIKLHFTSIYLLFLIDFSHSLPSVKQQGLSKQSDTENF